MTAVHPAHSATTSTIYVDAGGSGGTDPDGHTWQADKGFVGGSNGSTTATISGTTYQSVFRTWRHGMSAFRLPVSNGTYWVKLLESENYWTAAGKRVFDVKSEGKLVEDNLDIYAKAGGAHKALYVVFQTTVSDGYLDLGFTASHDQPIVGGIAIEPQTSSSSGSPGAGSLLWGMDDSSSFDSTEASMGRKFALVREYRRLDQSFVNSREQSLVNSGHALVLSVRADTISGHIKYADISAGKYDATFLAGLKILNGLATRPFFIFQHEPDANISKGSCSSSTADSVCGPQFVTAWKHVYNLAKSHGYTRPIFAWTMTAYAFNPQTNYRGNYYWVGTSYTDWIGVDQYNSDCPHNWWGSFTDMMQYSVSWLNAHAPTKSVIMPEWGAQEGSTSTAKANFFNNMPSELNQSGYTRFKAFSYWNNSVSSTCNYKINTSTASLNAYKNLGLTTAMTMKAMT